MCTDELQLNRAVIRESMARNGHIVVPGFLYHVTQRGTGASGVPQPGRLALIRDTPAERCAKAWCRGPAPSS